MTAWEVRNPIDYSANGDDVDTAAQKVKAEFEIVYQLLNRLRKLDASIGADVSDPEAYQLHINTSNGKLYIRNGRNDGWIELGDITQEAFGITAGKIGAVGKSEKMGKLYGGDANDSFPTSGVETHDLYFDYAKKVVYFYDGVSWQKLLSLNFGDMIDYEKYCVSRAEIGYNGAGKILRLDSITGKGNIDIAGSPAKLLGYPIEVANLRDDQVLTYDSAKQKFVNKKRDEFDENQIVLKDEHGVIHVDVDGSVNKIQGVPVVSLLGIKHGDVLVYCDRAQKFIPRAKDYVQEIDITETGEKKKLPRISNDGLLHVNISGYACGLNGVATAANGASDGDILVYRDTSGKFILEPKGEALGEGKSLRIYDGVQLLGEYNGSHLTDIDISSVKNMSLAKLEWQLAEVALALKEATGKRAFITDALFEDFLGDLSTLDTTTTAVTCIFASMMEIEVSDITNIVVGGIYTISDGNSSEEIQVESMTSEDDRYRLRLVNAINHSYIDGQATLTRSNVTIDQISSWSPMISNSWEDWISEEEYTYEIECSQGIDFYVFGGSINANGEIVMGVGNGREYRLEYNVDHPSTSSATETFEWEQVN